MMKRAFFLVVAAMTMYSCGQQPSGQQAQEPEIETRQISQLVSEPMTYENQVVRLEGMIGHICRHSGDKMRIIQTTDDAYSIEVMLMDQASQFSPEMEGQELVLVGTLKTEVVNMDELEAAHVHEGEEGDHECETTTEALEKMKEKGINPEIRTYVELVRVEEK